MIHTENLEQLILDARPAGSDEIVILSGNVTPSPVERIINLDMRVRIVYGMAPVFGVPEPIHRAFVRISAMHRNLSVLYSRNRGIHSKCFLWRRHSDLIRAYIGSANFTHSGLNTTDKEILIDADPDDFEVLNRYAERILGNTELCSAPELQTRLTRPAPVIAGPHPQPISAVSGTTLRFSLLTSDGRIPTGSGINWGHGASGRSHTSRDDAYIRIPLDVIRSYQGFFFPKATRQNDPVDLLWDDGISMRGLVEGNQYLNGILYPKQLSSFPEKRILGRYLRNRLHLPSGAFVTLGNLEQYGRTHIDVTCIAANSYYLDFSIPAT